MTPDHENLGYGQRVDIGFDDEALLGHDPTEVDETQENPNDATATQETLSEPANDDQATDVDESLPEVETDTDQPTSGTTTPGGPPVVAICGTAGGVGTTTVSALLAYVASRQDRGPVLLTDLGGPGASLAAYFDQESVHSLATAANAHRAGLLEQSSDPPFAALDRNLRLMAREPSIADEIPAHDPCLAELLANAQSAHFATFVDCGRLEHPGEQLVAAHATHIVWTAEGTESGARRANRVIRELGYRGSQFNLIYIRGRNGIPSQRAQQEFAEAATEHRLAIVLTEDLGDLVGQGLVTTARRAKDPVRRSLERILR